MDALKGHNNRTILGCQKRDEPTHRKGTEFLRVQQGRFLGMKLSEYACMPSMWSVNAIKAAIVVGINSRGRML